MHSVEDGNSSERFPIRVLFYVVAVFVIFGLLSGVQCHVGVHSVSQEHEQREVASECPRWRIMEQKGIRVLVDPNGGIIGIVEVK